MSLHGDIHCRKGDFELRAELAIPAQGVTALFGPSGCGKTTLLRILAGLETASEGQLAFEQQTWQNGTDGLSPAQRGVAMVYQQALLFPHLSVRGNLEFARKRARASCLSWQRVVELTRIEPLLGRQPQGLSGGERQRVAIAQALLSEPRLLLMDEPVSALDHAGRDALLGDLQRLFAELELPVVYVSHDLNEVARLADTIVWMGNGEIQAQGELHEVLTRLQIPGRYSEQELAILDAQFVEHDTEDGLSEVRCEGHRLYLPYNERARAPLRVIIHARDVSLTRERAEHTSILNIVPVTIDALQPMPPAQTLVRLKLGEQILLCRVTRRSARSLNLAPGLQLYAQIKSVALLD